MGADFDYPPVDFETHPDRYKHWQLEFDGPVAWLRMKVAEDGSLWPGRYELKMNSYDLGVDIELADAVERLRFEHPSVRSVVVTSAREKLFSAGANIRMLAIAPHAFKVNFCKFTNETRMAIEDATAHSGQTWIAALNGTAAGGGYELALACQEIWLIDDGNAAVALPEVPLLGVLPGTGGLTRLTDKRKVRRDIADVFCTKAEGFRAGDAKKYGFIDGSFPRSKWREGIEQRARQVAAQGPDKAGPGVPLGPLGRTETDDGWRYRYVTVRFEQVAGKPVVHLTIRGPGADPERSADTWGLRAFRELDDAILRLRVNHLDVGLVIIRTVGDSKAVIAHEAYTREQAARDWFWREVELLQARVLRRVDHTAKSFFALIEPGSCFAGVLFELALAADRTWMFLDEDGQNTIRLSPGNGGTWPMGHGRSRLDVRFPGDPEAPDRALSVDGPIDAETAEALGLVTGALDEIDWEDEIRIAVEERVSLSPDALTGMEQNLRFGGAETCDTKIFGRLSAWQNWIFHRPNAVGERGALTMYGQPERPVFDFKRT